MENVVATRRAAMLGSLGLAAAVVGTSSAKASQTAANVGGIHAIPELAPQWKELDLAEILSRPAAYCSVSQNKSCYDAGGVQAAEGHRERGSLPATVRWSKPPARPRISCRSIGSGTRSSARITQ